MADSAQKTSKVWRTTRGVGAVLMLGGLVSGVAGWFSEFRSYVDLGTAGALVGLMLVLLAGAGRGWPGRVFVPAVASPPPTPQPLSSIRTQEGHLCRARR